MPARRASTVAAAVWPPASAWRRRRSRSPLGSQVFGAAGGASPVGRATAARIAVAGVDRVLGSEVQFYGPFLRGRPVAQELGRAGLVGRQAGQQGIAGLEEGAHSHGQDRPLRVPARR